tara:strand:+ start:149 stop:832 length:684 start_codon:yes stop_codon:yes gene_type:complete
MSHSILIVDDEKDILEFLEYNLKKEGFKTLKATNGLEALKIAEEENPDMIVLDMMMPILTGIDTCKALREKPQFQDTIIVFLTARNTDEAEIESFEVGADDYISKPIRPKVFVKRINAILKRRLREESDSNFRQFNKLSIDLAKRKVFIENQVVKDIPKKQFQILQLLTSKPEKYFSREEIYTKIWGTDIIVGDRTLDVHIRKLREKIGSVFIKTSKGIGYAFIPSE